MSAIAGFAVLVLSDIAMLRDFGLVTVVDLTVSLLGVLVALPATLMLTGAPAEHGDHQGTSLLARAGAALGRRRPGGRARHEAV